MGRKLSTPMPKMPAMPARPSGEGRKQRTSPSSRMTALIVRAEATREFLPSTIERSSEYRDGNKVIRPINPCILARYDKTTETDCVDRVGWMGIPGGDEGERDRAGAETGL